MREVQLEANTVWTRAYFAQDFFSLTITAIHTQVQIIRKTNRNEWTPSETALRKCPMEEGQNPQGTTAAVLQTMCVLSLQFLTAIFQKQKECILDSIGGLKTLQRALFY